MQFGDPDAVGGTGRSFFVTVITKKRNSIAFVDSAHNLNRSARIATYAGCRTTLFLQRWVSRVRLTAEGAAVIATRSGPFFISKLRR